MSWPQDPFSPTPDDKEQSDPFGSSVPSEFGSTAGFESTDPFADATEDTGNHDPFGSRPKGDRGTRRLGATPVARRRLWFVAVALLAPLIVVGLVTSTRDDGGQRIAQRSRGDDARSLVSSDTPETNRASPSTMAPPISAPVTSADSSGRRNTLMWRCVMGRQSGWLVRQTGRPAMRSPGRPPIRRDVERAFWVKIAEGLTSEDAAIACGVSGSVGSRWFRERGGMPTVELGPSTGRYLSFSEREEIALLRAGLRSRGRSAGHRRRSHVSCRNAATRGAKLEYLDPHGLITTCRIASLVLSTQRMGRWSETAIDENTERLSFCGEETWQVFVCTAASPGNQTKQIASPISTRHRLG